MNLKKTLIAALVFPYQVISYFYSTAYLESEGYFSPGKFSTEDIDKSKELNVYFCNYTDPEPECKRIEDDFFIKNLGNTHIRWPSGYMRNYTDGSLLVQIEPDYTHCKNEEEKQMLDLHLDKVISTYTAISKASGGGMFPVINSPGDGEINILKVALFPDNERANNIKGYYQWPANYIRFNPRYTIDDLTVSHEVMHSLSYRHPHEKTLAPIWKNGAWIKSLQCPWYGSKPEIFNQFSKLDINTIVGYAHYTQHLSYDDYLEAFNSVSKNLTPAQQSAFKQILGLEGDTKYSDLLKKHFTIFDIAELQTLYSKDGYEFKRLVETVGTEYFLFKTELQDLCYASKNAASGVIVNKCTQPTVGKVNSKSLIDLAGLAALIPISAAVVLYCKKKQKLCFKTIQTVPIQPDNDMELGANSHHQVDQGNRNDPINENNIELGSNPQADQDNRDNNDNEELNNGFTERGDGNLQLSPLFQHNADQEEVNGRISQPPSEPADNRKHDENKKRSLANKSGEIRGL
jgi:hypothetical protein